MIETAAQGETAAPDWDAPSFENMPAPGEAFVVDIDGFEGPLDLLLALARTQKVDIAKISILALVEQYLGFIAQAQQLRLEIAADYLVMAAWLAYLKSRLLLPKDKDDADTASAEELAQRLAFRLMRLEAMRGTAATLMTRRRLDRDVFARGLPESIKVSRDTTYTATVYDLLKAYADQRKRTVRHRARRQGAARMVDQRGAATPRKAGRGDGRRLGSARSFPGAISAQRRGGAHRARKFLRGDARNGARRVDRDPAGRAVRADLHAQT